METDTRTHARQIERRNRTNESFEPRYDYSVPYAKYRLESIKEMVRTRKEPGGEIEICDVTTSFNAKNSLLPVLIQLCTGSVRKVYMLDTEYRVWVLGAEYPFRTIFLEI